MLSIGAQGHVRSLRQLILPGGAGVNYLAVDDEQQVWVGSNRAELLVARAQLPGQPIDPTDVPERNVHALHLDL